VPFNKNMVVIVLKPVNNDKETLMGIVVDGVSETYRFDSDKIQPPPELNDNARSNFINGLASIDEKLVILLNIDQLIDFDEVNNVANQSDEF
jgi:purine-binding chemotaxis protein CheW